MTLKEKKSILEIIGWFFTGLCLCFIMVFLLPIYCLELLFDKIFGKPEMYNFNKE